MSNQLLTEAGVGLLTQNFIALDREYYVPFWTNTNNTLTQEDQGNLLFQDNSYIVLQSYEDTDWPGEAANETSFDRTMLNIVQENGDNLLFQDGTFIALQSFGSTVWTRTDG